MEFAELALLGLALSMDAFAVTISDMFGYKGSPKRRLLLLPVAFGLFQGLMPVLGYFLGGVFGDFIESYAGIITLIILGIIGGKMVVDGVSELRASRAASAEASGAALGFKVILVQAVATSIDAFAVGVSLRAEAADIFVAGPVIALVTCACCFIALALGRRAGDALGDKAQIVGGAVLVCIGLKAFLF